jgi:hypothetical protein
MEHKHLDAAALERLLAMDRTAEQNEQLFHLLDLCPSCREAGSWLLELHQAQALPLVFGPIEAALARSRAEAPQLLEELAPLDPQDRLARLQVSRRYVSWGLCELLVREPPGRTGAGLGSLPPRRPGRPRGRPAPSR